MGEANNVQATPFVEPKDWEEFSEHLVLGVIVNFGEATMRGGLTAAALKEMRDLAKKLTGPARQKLKDTVIAGLSRNEHMHLDPGGLLLGRAAAIALSSEAGNLIDIMLEGGRTGVVYEITRLGDNSYNWRLMMSPMRCAR